MYQDPNIISAPHLSADAVGIPGAADIEIVRLVGTVVSHVEFRENGIEVKGKARGGEQRWCLCIRGSARFTFSHGSESGSWLVEANFDAGGPLRSSERAMICAVSGALVESFCVAEEGLLIRSDDGRGIEVPYALNEEGIVIEILPDELHTVGSRVVLPAA